jgi:hypothetical protein
LEYLQTFLEGELLEIIGFSPPSPCFFPTVILFLTYSFLTDIIPLTLRWPNHAICFCRQEIVSHPFEPLLSSTLSSPRLPCNPTLPTTMDNTFIRASSR